MAMVKADDLNIGCREKGRGDAIIFLHGVGSDKSVWDEQLNYFAKRWRAVSLDYPGYGESDLAARDLQRADIARYILDAMSALGIEQAHIVGLSMGGVIALEMWRREPARLRSLTLADTFAKHPHAQSIVERTRQAMAALSMRDFAESRVRLVLRPDAPEALQRQVVESMAAIDKRSYAWATVAVWTCDYRADLPQLKVPALVIVGEHDQITPLALSEELRAGIAGAKLIVIPEAGHISNVENPAAFNRAVEEFIGPLN